MARIIVRRSRLSLEYQKVLRKACIAYFFFVAFFLVFFAVALRSFAWWQLSLLFLSAIGFWVARSTQKERGMYRQGLRGERQVLRILRKLDKECLVASNALIGAGKRYEVDMLVCSPGAVTLVEVKHYKGTVEVKEGNWSVRKGRHRKDVGTPKNQLLDRVQCARQLLTKNGFRDIDVRGVLVFGEDTQVDEITYARLKKEKLRTFFLSLNEGKELLRYIGNRDPKGVAGRKLYEALVRK